MGRESEAGKAGKASKASEASKVGEHESKCLNETLEWTPIGADVVENRLDSCASLFATGTAVSDEIGSEGGNMGKESDEGDAGDMADEMCVLVAYSLLTLGWLCLMARVFHEREHWREFDAFYWAFITATTIGFGDFAPELTKWWPSTHAYIMVSLILMAL
jgi:hypothetical protein